MAGAPGEKSCIYQEAKIWILYKKKKIVEIQVIWHCGYKLSLITQV